jgi:hypothetical protein
MEARVLQVLAVVLESVTKPVLSIFPSRDVAHILLLSHQDLDGLTKHILSRTIAGGLCLVG